MKTQHIGISEDTTPLLWSIFEMRGIPPSDGHTYMSDSDCWQHSISSFEDAIKAGANLYSFRDEEASDDDIYFFIGKNEEELVKKWSDVPDKSFTPLADIDEEFEEDD